MKIACYLIHANIQKVQTKINIKLKIIQKGSKDWEPYIYIIPIHPWRTGAFNARIKFYFRAWTAFS